MLTRAGEAKTLIGVEQEKETIELAYYAALGKKTNTGDLSEVTSDDLKNELNTSNVSVSGDTTITVTFIESNRQYTIDSDGIITYQDINDDNELKGKTLLQALKDGEIAVGNYVNYEAPNVNITINGEESGAQNQIFSITTQQSNQMGWRILGYGNNNGELTLNKNEATNVLLISSNPTQKYLALGKSNGYYNGITILNDICKNFSTDKINASTNFSVNKTTGRSIKIEDIYTILGLSLERDGFFSNTYVYQNGDWVIGNPPVKLTTDTNDSNFEERTAQLKGNSYYFSDEEYNANIELYDFILKNGTYWLANRGGTVVDGGIKKWVEYGTGYVDINLTPKSYGNYFSSEGNWQYWSNMIVPVISLSANSIYGAKDGEFHSIESCLDGWSSDESTNIFGNGNY